MKNNLEIGKYGENIAIDFLKKQNLKIIARNFLCKQGEIDIIAKDKDEIIFCEVKTRNTQNYGRPVEAVNNVKQRHMWNAAKFYLYSNNLNGYSVRFDVIEVYINKNKIFINQIRNMFY